MRTAWLTGGCIFLVLCAARGFGQSRDPYAEPRLAMVRDFIAAEGVTHPGVLESVRKVPRHLFVRPDLRPLAYSDQALDIGFKQTISPPFIVAYMTQVLDPQPTDRVLEIGTGSGYQAAVLSPLVSEVYTIEIVEPLGKRAADLLKRLGYSNVKTRVGDGYLGWPEAAPFDKIIVTCSPEDVPQPLVEQLRDGGKMIIPLGERYQQAFHLLEKQGDQLVKTRLIPTLFVPMTGKMEELRRIQPDGSQPRLANGGFERAESADGLADGWHYQRRSRLVMEGAPEGKQFIQFENDVPGREAHMLQGLAIDGTRVGKVTISLLMRSSEIRQGPRAAEVPGVLLHFFDNRRLPIGQVSIGPWLADQPQWTRITRTLDVPREAQEAILQVGLNGATGVLALDQIELTPQPR